MRLRWKKDKRDKGLAGVAAGPIPSTLRIDGAVIAAVVYSHNRSHSKWYWVAGWDARDRGVPHKNTCNEPPLSEEGAKAAALAYVAEHLSAQRCP